MRIPTIFKSNRLLSEVCTFGIGGPARCYTEVKTIEDLQQALQVCNKEKLPYLILGKGSNCLFDDRGFDGALILNKIDFIEKNSSPGMYKAGAGYSFSLLGVQTARKGFQGLEFASGIPASVGGAVFMNAGANGVETCESLSSVVYIDPEGVSHVFEKKDLSFAYRQSCFQTMPGAIAAASFTLKPCSEARTKQLEIIKYRQKSQPYGEKSAGCVFRNPMCGYAGRVIEESGLKGFRIGGAKVSEMHANFIVNLGNASSKDVLELIAFVRHKVLEKTGIELESEVRIIPYQKEHG